MRKETPVSQLHRRYYNPVVEAERQGFDDGYFGNRKIEPCDTIAVDLAYAKGFDEGKLQRKSADKAEKKRKVKA